MSQQNANNKMVLKLIVIVIGMFGFGFALVPLYDVFCDVAGINGKTDKTADSYLLNSTLTNIGDCVVQ